MNINFIWLDGDKTQEEISAIGEKYAKSLILHVTQERARPNSGSSGADGYFFYFVVREDFANIVIASHSQEKIEAIRGLELVWVEENNEKSN